MHGQNLRSSSCPTIQYARFYTGPQPGERRMSLTIGVLAGEVSGDLLGASLMDALHKRAEAYGGISFVGVGGEQMCQRGLTSLAELEDLSVQGFIDPLLRLPQLLGLQRRLLRRFVDIKIDAFVGIDFNVFNFMLEKRLKRAGVLTAHYVSPSVYAWRKNRVYTVAASADLLFCLYPFEPKQYLQTSVKAIYVGHPLTNSIAADAGNQAEREAARRDLGLSLEQPVLALLPGSRASELKYMLPTFLEAARQFNQKMAQAAQIVIPCVNDQRLQEVSASQSQYPDLWIHPYRGNASRGLQASDVALVKSGTGTLEAALLQRPLVMSYKTGSLNYQLARRLIELDQFALPNILLGRPKVPEFIQDAATPEALAEALFKEWHASQAEPDYLQDFQGLYQTLAFGESGLSAADAAGAALLERLARLTSLSAHDA